MNLVRLPCPLGQCGTLMELICLDARSMKWRPDRRRRHRSQRSARGAYSDITIAEADNQKIPPEDKTAAPPPQTVTPANPSTVEVPPAVETTPGEESKGVPPRKP